MKSKTFEQVYGEYPTFVQKIKKNVTVGSWIKGESQFTKTGNLYCETFYFTFKLPVKLKKITKKERQELRYDISNRVGLENQNVNLQHQIDYNSDKFWYDNSCGHYITLVLNKFYNFTINKCERLLLRMLHIDDHNFYFDINLDKEKELKGFIQKDIKKFGQQEFEDYINTHFGTQY